MSLFQKTKRNKFSLALALLSLFFFIGSAYFVSPIFAFVPPGTLDPGCDPTNSACTIDFYGDTNARAAISLHNLDGITYSSSTGIFTLTPGYIIPASTSTDTWNNLLSASSTWNDAASWGNHATFGYLTTSSAAGTYLPLSASSTFLSTTSAAGIYLTQDNASSTYLSKDSASSTYLTQTNANSIYLSQVNANLNYLSTSSAAATYLNLSATSSFARLSGAIFDGSISATNFSGSATGTNTGDESSSTIRTKIGAATASNDGYLSASDWNIFNSKISSPWLTITNYSSLSSVPAIGGTAFSDSNWPSNVPSQAFDGVIDGYNTGWINLNGHTGILGYQFAFGKILTRYTIYPWHGAQNESGRRPKNWTFEGSNNGVSYTVLDTQVNQTSWTTSVGNIYTFSNSSSYIYYRLNISDNTGDANTAIAEMQFSGSGSPDTYSAAAGNVGIGTTNPLAKFDVNGDLLIEGINKLSFNSLGNESINSPAVGEIDMISRGNYKFYADTNNNDGNTYTEYEWHTQEAQGSSSKVRMAIRNDGNVGIGTTTLNSRLSVVGSGTTGSTINFQSFNSAGTPMMTVLDNGNVGFFAYTSLADIDAPLTVKKTVAGTGVTTITNWSNNIDSNFHFDISNTGESDKRAVWGPTTNTAVAFQTNGAERMRISPSGFIGIGTTTPYRMLSLYSADTNTSPGFNITSGSVGGRNYSFLSTAQNSALGAGKFTIYDEASSTDRFTIDKNGNVGIGTNNPEQKLDVNGILKLERVATTTLTGKDYPAIYGNLSGITGDATYNGALILQSRSSANQPIMFVTGSTPSIKMMIGGTGKVGIGTTNVASDNFDVVGSGSAGAAMEISSSNNTVGNLNNRAAFTLGRRIDSGSYNTTGWQFLKDENDSFAIRKLTNGTASSSPAMIITTNGSIGIGTTSTVYPLTVDGAGYFSGNILASNFYGTSTGLNTGDESSSTIRSKLGLASSTASGYLSSLDWNTFNNKLDSSSFSNLTTNYIIKWNGTNFASSSIFDNGNIGIGTSTPTQILTVAGNQYLTGAFFDGSYASGTAGMILQTTGTSTRWVATSTLGLTGGSSQWLTSGSDISYPSGNVSIGTSSQNGLFQVYSPGINTVVNVPTMTSNTSPSGVASCSSAYNASTDCYRAFAGLTYNGWLSLGTPTGVLQYQFPTGKTVQQYSIIPWSIDNFSSRSPKTWTFEASNNGTDWVVLDSRTNYTSWVSYTASNFSFTNSTSYSYYRLNVSANGGDTYLGVQNLGIYSGVNIPAGPALLVSGSTGQVGFNTLDLNSAQVSIVSNSLSTAGLIVQGSSLQTANLQNWQGGSGNILSAIDKNGYLGIGTSTPNSALSVVGSGVFSGNLTVAGTINGTNIKYVK